jgi:hypothetical protein
MPEGGWDRWYFHLPSRVKLPADAAAAPSPWSLQALRNSFRSAACPHYEHAHLYLGARVGVGSLVVLLAGVQHTPDALSTVRYVSPSPPQAPS